MTKPVPKMNLIHQQILAGLITTKQGTRTHKTIDHKTPDITGGVIETTVPVIVAPTGLAANVSERNVEILAKRWSR